MIENSFKFIDIVLIVCAFSLGTFQPQHFAENPKKNAVTRWTAFEMCGSKTLLVWSWLFFLFYIYEELDGTSNLQFYTISGNNDVFCWQSQMFVVTIPREFKTDEMSISSASHKVKEESFDIIFGETRNQI